jgi:hypothetical protein
MYLTILNFGNPICAREVGIIVSDNDDHLSPGPKVWKYFGIKHFLEAGILIRRPFVEKIDGSVLQQRCDQGKTFALAF